MEKNADAFRTISEVAEELDLPQHVLRFWETRFTQIKPLKRGGGRRYYRPDDIELLRVIRHLLYGEGYTIKGVQKILKEQGVRASISAYRAAVAAGGDRMSLVFCAPAENHGGVSLPEELIEPDDRPEEDPHSPSFLPESPVSEGGGKSPLQRSSIGLAEGDLRRLKALLSELAECERILQAARRA